MSTATAKMWAEAYVVSSKKITGEKYTELVQLVAYQGGYGIRSARSLTKGGSRVSGYYTRYDSLEAAEAAYDSIED